MNYKVRKGNDLTFKLTMNGNTFHKFNEVKSLSVLLSHNYLLPTSHIPTETQTNQCCGQLLTTPLFLIKSLVTSYTTDKVVVQALFPVYSLRTDGVYSIFVGWCEKTADIIADNELFNYTIDLIDTIELVDEIKDAVTAPIELEFTFNNKV